MQIQPQQLLQRSAQTAGSTAVFCKWLKKLTPPGIG